MKKYSLYSFLEELENKKIYYRLEKIRDSIMVCVAVPGQRWEIEFFGDGKIEIEIFASNGVIYGEKEIETLFKNFSD